MRAIPRLSLILAGAVALQAQSARVVRPFVSLAFTTGGDTLATATYTDGSSSSIKAGGETLFKGGLDFQVARAFSLQCSYGLHTDSTKEATNGSMDFKRSAIEGLGFWHPSAHTRLGLGFRKTSDARVTGSGAAATETIHFDSSTGTILEFEYLSGPLTSFGSRGGISLRYVNEKYSPTSIDGIGPVTGPGVDGSHIGIGFSWYF
jgi:hypothetical protein